MSRIFISYRHYDAAGYAGRIYDRLSSHYEDEDEVFIDTRIKAGEDFVETIEKELNECRIQVVVIGRRWATIADGEGNQRLDDPEDFVRWEVTTALDRKIRVIPVLVNDATMPTAKELPEPLKRLARRQALVITDKYFHENVDELIELLEK
ncbi:MAG: TIR domain-containing protein [Anaerolineae bacterium]|nr:TIR domain-containing protein [Anaerolineae bacterium]